MVPHPLKCPSVQATIISPLGRTITKGSSDISFDWERLTYPDNKAAIETKIIPKVDKNFIFCLVVFMANLY
jgi:hypothetical protein